MSIEYSIIATTKKGEEVKIIGPHEAIDRIAGALEDAGFEYNEQVDCWDEGYYDSTKTKRRRARA